MKIVAVILSIVFFVAPYTSYSQQAQQKVSFDFYGDTIEFVRTDAAAVAFPDSLSRSSIQSFYNRMEAAGYQPALGVLLAYKQKRHPDDWVFYQLIRRTAQAMSPKADNYYRYTLYKWFFLCKSGYNATLGIIDNKMLFYVESDDEVYDIPFFHVGGKRFICLNYHDYGYAIDFDKNQLRNVSVIVPGAVNRFSYRLTSLPDFKAESYYEKDLQFSYCDVTYHLKVKLNADVKNIFTNYPVVDYGLFFDAPLSKDTYNTLIPQLEKNLKGMDVKQGVDYLMHFTRYAFIYQPDKENFGREKHMSPEQTLLYDRSDCADRAALFYCLVKEIYHLPMVVLAYPHHLTVAVKFDKPVGEPVIYNGSVYTLCEPTPQIEDLPLGRVSSDLSSASYTVAYAYEPK